MSQFLTESIRQGLPHIHSMDHGQFSNLVKTGKIHLKHATEKTDGMTHVMGHDEHGFYTQSSGSGSEKMRHPSDFEHRAKRRAKETGKEYDPTAAHAFGAVHHILSKNKHLQAHLKAQHEKTGHDVKIRGEVFHKPLGKPSDTHPYEIKFVGTSYDPSHMGSVGKYVVHSKLPDNHHVSDHHLKHFSTHEINFDHDKIENHNATHVDVRHEAEKFKHLNHELLNSRTTKTNKEAKEKEHEKFTAIKHQVSAKVDDHVSKAGISPKWGSGTEGVVVHPSKEHPHQPRFKVTSAAFRKYKADPENAKKFKSRLKEMYSFKGFLTVLSEGGNIKVGSAHAAPFHVTEKNREERQKDIHHALTSIHDTFHKEHGGHLFGPNHKALKSGTAYSGSTKHLMHKDISHKEFAHHKPHVGDVDVQIPHEHKEKLAHHLATGKKFGKYTVAGTKKHGNEVSAVMKHENGEHHQFDFEGGHHIKGEPSKGEQFIKSSDWHDTKAGIKGVHHKLLINAAGRTHHKFSNTHGLKSRTDEHDIGTKHPDEVTHKLFGKDADPKHIHSFHGVTHLIKKHIAPEHHQEIYDKMKAAEHKNLKGFNNGPAFEHLKKHLNVKEHTNEDYLLEQEEHHTSVIPLVGFSPISHMGHAHDLGGALKKLPGKKHIGISSKADAFSDKERSHILKRQWHHVDAEHHITKHAGEVIAKAYHGLPKHGKKHLHLLVGGDRKEFAHNIKHALEHGKIKEMGTHKFDHIHIHTPEDEGRAHGMSGTKMRHAAATGDKATFSKHLGPMFSNAETGRIMRKVHKGIQTGKIKLKR